MHELGPGVDAFEVGQPVLGLTSGVGTNNLSIFLGFTDPITTFAMVVARAFDGM